MVLWCGLNFATGVLVVGLLGRVFGAGPSQLLRVPSPGPPDKNLKVIYGWCLPMLGLEAPGRDPAVN